MTKRIMKQALREIIELHKNCNRSLRGIEISINAHKIKLNSVQQQERNAHEKLIELEKVMEFIDEKWREKYDNDKDDLPI